MNVPRPEMSPTQKSQVAVDLDEFFRAFLTLMARASSPKGPKKT